MPYTYWFLANPTTGRVRKRLLRFPGCKVRKEGFESLVLTGYTEGSKDRGESVSNLHNVILKIVEQGLWEITKRQKVWAIHWIRNYADLWSFMSCYDNGRYPTQLFQVKCIFEYCQFWISKAFRLLKRLVLRLVCLLFSRNIIIGPVHTPVGIMRGWSEDI